MKLNRYRQFEQNNFQYIDKQGADKIKQRTVNTKVILFKVGARGDLMFLSDVIDYSDDDAITVAEHLFNNLVSYYVKEHVNIVVLVFNQLNENIIFQRKIRPDGYEIWKCRGLTFNEQETEQARRIAEHVAFYQPQKSSRRTSKTAS
jgi:hypothetical protein